MEQNDLIPSQPPIDFKSNYVAKRTLRPLTARKENVVQPIPFTNTVILPAIIPGKAKQADKEDNNKIKKTICAATIVNILLFLATIIACVITLLLLLRGKYNLCILI